MNERGDQLAMFLSKDEGYKSFGTSGTSLSPVQLTGRWQDTGKLTLVSGHWRKYFIHISSSQIYSITLMIFATFFYFKRCLWFWYFSFKFAKICTESNVSRKFHDYEFARYQTLNIKYACYRDGQGSSCQSNYHKLSHLTKRILGIWINCLKFS